MLKRELWKLELRLLTPAFLGGAEPRRVDPYMPLRPSTVRGMLRWWFRAAAGALLWTRDGDPGADRRVLQALREAEAKVFGDTEHASPVAILPPTGGSCRGIDPPDPRQRPGVRYLGYGLFEDRQRLPEALETPPSLTLTIDWRRSVAGARALVSATFWLWIAFGGLGARSRRGFGSLALVSGGDALGWPDSLKHAATNREELKRQLNTGLDGVIDTFRRELPRLTSHPLSEGDRPHAALRTIDGIQTVTVLPVDAESSLEALDRTGRLIRDFRSTLERNRLGLPPLADYFAVKASIGSRRPPTELGRAAFGLPLPFFFRSLQGAKATFVPVRPGGAPRDAALDRLASPLLVRIHELGDANHRSYVSTLVNLAGRRGAQPLLGCQLVERGAQQAFDAPGPRLLSELAGWATKQAERMYARRGRS